MRERVSLGLLAIIIFLIPTNLFLKFGESFSYVHGLQVDYLIPKLYLSDIFIFLFCGWEVFAHKVHLSSFLRKQLALFMGLLFLLQLFAQNQVAALWYFFKLLEFIIFAGILLQKKSLQLNKVLLLIAVAVLFQSLLGLYQFTTQKSFFPSYLFLGEVRFVQSIGVTEGNFAGQERSLPYGTTAHPNILAGFLALGILFLYRAITQKKILYQRLVMLFSATILLAAYIIFLTQSFSAALFLVLGLGFVSTETLVRKIPNYISLGAIITALIFSPLFIHLAAQKSPDNLSLTRRDILNQAAWKMFKTSPLTGVGLNNFTVHLENFSHSKEVPRFVQPAHHLGLLWLAETGIFGLVGVILLGVVFYKHNLLFWTLPLLPIGVLDHYLLTQQTGLLVGILYLFFIHAATDSSRRQ